MSSKLNEIKIVFNNYTNNLKVINDFEVIGNNIIGSIKLFCDSKPDVIFEVIINSNYPLKNGEVESISFVNIDLKEYAHINHNGTVCFRTPTTPNLSYKLDSDIKAILEWFDKYYIEGLVDNHFEYLVYENHDDKQVFLFCDTDVNPSVNDFGFVYFTKRNITGVKNTFLIQGLKSKIQPQKILFKWSDFYSDFKKSFKGLYFISDIQPVYFRNFAFNKWTDFEVVFNQDFLKFLNDSKKGIEKKDLIDGKYFILLYGYPINDGKINFETIKIDYYDIPVFKGNLKENKVVWCKTVDSSYDLFFGRGKLNANFCDSKVLILGNGAIGSNLAESLVRGGCKYLDIFDNDIKEIGNICRAKYDFINGETLKVDELMFSLISISPFLNIRKFNFSVVPLQNEELRKLYQDFFDNYDIIFNCTASNDVNIILDSLLINGQLITISISNNAKDLVCVIGNENVFETNSKIYNEIKQDLNDMFNPQGCWNPTFKASFHNINTLLNYALSNIDYKLKTGLPLKTFVLEVKEEENYSIKLKD